MKMLITGSRNTTPDMLEHVQAIMLVFAQHGVSIIVGDAPGIDKAVIDACDRLGIPVEVHGAYGKIRNATKTGTNVTHPVSYSERDELMAARCDECYAIWNGRSNGTMITLKAADKLGKRTWLYKAK